MDGFVEINAAVVRQVNGPFRIEPVLLAEPREDEVTVKLVAVGVCHTDLTVAHGLFPMTFPAVLGHEGAGVVTAVGARVKDLAVGDHVVLSYSTCGSCPRCEAHNGVYCSNFGRMNFGGRRLDGSETLRDAEGPINGAFFGQSSFATHAVVRESDAVKVPKDVPLELLGPLGCGFQTGAGTVMNVLRPTKESTLAVLGTGAVGLAAVMAAKAMGCGRIVAVDRVASRLELARELGADITLEGGAVDLRAEFKALGGLDCAVETTGAPAVVADTIASLRSPAVCALMGAGADTRLELDMYWLLGGRTVVGVREGHADPQTFIPRLIELYRAGAFPIDRLIRFYPFVEIEQAMMDAEAGRTIKPVLRF